MKERERQREKQKQKGNDEEREGARTTGEGTILRKRQREKYFCMNALQ